MRMHVFFVHFILDRCLRFFFFSFFFCCPLTSNPSAYIFTSMICMHRLAVYNSLEISGFLSNTFASGTYVGRTYLGIFFRRMCIWQFMIPSTIGRQK
ncbi:hypothetical protein DFH27DRAFT_394989 [Peziza echinospora]|nr:hypothetical protein DFH27DRAFT_394989 [Peziza echinospora]